jgi:hypothetical protein
MRMRPIESRLTLILDPQIWGKPSNVRPLLSDQALRQIVEQRPPETVETLPAVEWARNYFLETSPELFHEFSDEHRSIYEWSDEITDTHTPEPLVAILPRGHGKTTTLDMVVLRLMTRMVNGRDVIVFIAKNMKKSTERVASLLKAIQRPYILRKYPKMSMPMLNVRGMPVAWGSEMFTNALGQTVIAASIGSDNRGYNIDHARVGMFVCDDLDKQFDSLALTKRKESILTHDIIPAEAGHVPAALVFIQNLIKMGGIADRVVTGESEFCRHARVLGPQVAVEGLEVEPVEVHKETSDGTMIKVIDHKIVAGRATWEGQDIEACQEKINRWGLSAFMREQQQKVDDYAGALLKSTHFRYWDQDKPFDPSSCRYRVVGVDPSGGRAECGIVVCGVVTLAGGGLPQFYVIEDLSHEIGPNDDDWAETALRAAIQYRATVLCEGNYGGKMVTERVKDAVDRLRTQGQMRYFPKIEPVYASNSKRDRAVPVQGLVINGQVMHIKKFIKLENEWTTWDPSQPGQKDSPNRLDAEVHAIIHLRDLVESGIGPAFGM